MQGLLGFRKRMHSGSTQSVRGIRVSSYKERLSHFTVPKMSGKLQETYARNTRLARGGVAENKEKKRTRAKKRTKRQKKRKRKLKDSYRIGVCI